MSAASAQSPPSPRPPSADEVARQARAGLLFIPAAKAWFLVAGLLLQLLLPRALGSPALFGIWTLVLGWLSWPNNVLVTATIQTVSHFAAHTSVEAAKRAALRLNLLLAGGVALLFCLSAPLIAAFEHDPELTDHLRLASLIVFMYGLYAVFVGAANGARQFHKQAGLDIVFATLRVGFVLAAAMWFHATLPALFGFVLAAAVILIVSIAWVGLPKSTAEAAIPPARLLRYVAWLGVYLAAINVLMFLDGWWLKRLCTDAALNFTGQATTPASIKATVDTLVGHYGAAQTISRLPYQLILAGAFVIFPVLSLPDVQADRARARTYVTTTLRFALIVTLGLAVALGARPTATMRLLYPPEYVTAAPALAILLCAYACFALLTISGTITNSLGYTWQTALLGVCTAVGTTLAVYVAVQRSLALGAFGHPLRAAALGLLAGMATGLFANLLFLWLRLRTTLPIPTLVRAGLAAALALALGRFWPAAGTATIWGSKLGTLASSACCFGVYLVVLVVLKELSPRELLATRRRRPTAPSSASGIAS